MSESLIPAQGQVDVNVRGLHDRLQARADNAYCDYIGLCRRDECLGWEAKVENELFGDAELKAHKDDPTEMPGDKVRWAATCEMMLAPSNASLTGA